MKEQLTHEVNIDAEFQALIPPLSLEELTQLRENLIEDGCREPLVIWTEENVLLDGHNRYAICTAENIPFQTTFKSFGVREDALDWIDSNQLGRRNLSPDQMSLLRGRIYNRNKKGQGRPEGKSYQTDNLKTHEALSERLGVSPATIARDGAYASAAQSLGIEADISTGEIVAPRQAVVEAAREVRANPERIGEIIEELKSPHVTKNTGENEWYTPSQFIEASRKVMGGIDCDPASCELANKTVRATKFYTKETDGRDKPWGSRVWMNPPYAQPLIGDFCKGLAERVASGQVSQACILVNNATETAWFRELISVASAVMFTKGRVRFIDKDGAPSGAPLQGQALVYIGSNTAAFEEQFGEMGWVAWL